MIKKLNTWYCHTILRSATEAEILEWYKEEELRRSEDEAAWLADQHQQNEMWRADEDTPDLPETQEDEDLLHERSMTDHEEDRSQCPLCGTPWVHYGRCKPCDRAFGRD